MELLGLIRVQKTTNSEKYLQKFTFVSDIVKEQYFVDITCPAIKIFGKIIILLIGKLTFI